MALAARIARAAPQLSSIWPGYWPQEQAFIIHVKDQGAVLVSPGEPPAGFLPISGSELPPELAGRAFYHEGTMPSATRPFILDYPIGNGRTGVLVNADPKAEETASLILHEQFHAYQSTAFKGREDQFVDPLAIKDRVAFAAAAETEKRILAAALKAKTLKERKELLRHYFALRRERESSVPSALRLVERGFERIEGTAKYVDRIAHAILFGNGKADVEPLLVRELTKTEPRSSAVANSSAPFAGRWFRGRAYSTGAALSQLLTKYDPDWRPKIEKGAKLDELLETHVGGGRNPAALAKAARERFGYEEALRTLGPLIREAEKKEIKSVKEFMALGGYAVALKTSNPVVDGKQRYGIGFQAMGILTLGPGITALPRAILFNMSGPSLELTVRESPLLMNGETLTALLNGAPSIDGKGELPPGEHKLDKLHVSGEGYELRLDRPALLTVTPGSMEIRVQEPD